MSIEGFVIREAERKDIPTIRELIIGLAEYEKLAHEVVATEELLEEWLFEKQKAEVFIGEYKGVPVGFTLFFHNFSTFLGRAGIYLEDLFVKPEFRGRGFGKAMLVHLAKVAVSRGCGRFEWSCLDWNKPSIEFYLSMGAKPMEGWTVYRVTGDKLTEMTKL